MKKLLIATKNSGKFSEIKQIFDGLPFEIVSLLQIGETQDFEEKDETFKENAVAKAKFFAEKTLLWTIADDGGLTIDALDGEPGVHTRRWPGYTATDEELVKYCLEKMRAIPPKQRGAKFTCVAALAVPRNGVYTTTGVVEGFISDEPKGKHLPGLEFDVLFYYPPYKKTFGQVSAEMKQLVSHRSQAFKKLKRKIMTLLENEK